MALKEAALANIRFDAAYEKAIEDKQIEEQRAEQQLYELVQAQRQADIVAATAKGKGEAAGAQAEGEADALRTKGEAEATYNAKVAASLTPGLIQHQYLVRWNGQLPQSTLGGGTTASSCNCPAASRSKTTTDVREEHRAWDMTRCNPRMLFITFFLQWFRWPNMIAETEGTLTTKPGHDFLYASGEGSRLIRGVEKVTHGGSVEVVPPRPSTLSCLQGFHPSSQLISIGEYLPLLLMR